MPPAPQASQPSAEAAPPSRGIRSDQRRLAASTLVAQVTDDYSTEKSKPVPAGARVPRWHLAALWITLLGGVPTLAVGIDFYQSGYSLARALAAVAVGSCCYLAYAIPAAYLGARTGRGAALLARHVFGPAASVVISDLLIAAGVARLAFASTVVASLYSALFGWRDVALIAAGLAVVAAAVNLFGFAGIAAAARYLTAPLLLAWAGCLVIHGLLTPHVGLGAAGPQTLPFQAGAGVAIGAIAWGNEPDVGRYGKAKLGWPAAPYLAAVAAGSLLIAAAGWLMASLSRTGTQAAFVHGVRFSTFGVLGLAAVVITTLQIASSSAACYQITNAVQNFVGQMRGWRRWHTAILVAALGGLATWATQGSVTGFARAAAWSAVVLPSVTVVMCAELLGWRRQPGTDRSRRIKIPPWGKGARPPNWAAIAAVLVAAGYGGWGMALLPGQHAAPGLGFVPVQAWLLAAGLYTAVVTVNHSYAAARSALSRARDAARRAAARRAEARKLAAASRAEAKAAAKRARAGRRHARPAKLPPKPVPPPRPRPRDYLEAIRRDLGNGASGNPYLELVCAAAVPRGRLGDLAAEQAQLRVSDRRSFLHLAARSNDPVGALFAELADAERRALELLTVFAGALGRRAESGDGPQRAGCRAYPAFVAWLALNADPVDAALAVVACRPAWSTSFAGIGRALRENPGYRFDEGSCAFFDVMAGLDAHTEDQLIGVVSASVETGQPPLLAAGYARMLAAYQAMFWTALAAEAMTAAGAAH